MLLFLQSESHVGSNLKKEVLKWTKLRVWYRAHYVGTKSKFLYCPVQFPIPPTDSVCSHIISAALFKSELNYDFSCMYIYVCVCVCVSARARACVCLFVCVLAHRHACVWSGWLGSELQIEGMKDSIFLLSTKVWECYFGPRLVLAVWL
jgi:hypothetical protein